MSESRLQTAITIIPVISAGLYLLGTAYYQGYLAGFGLEDSLFPLATDRSLFSGFVAFVSFGAVPAVYTASAIFIFCFVILFAAILSSTERVKRLQAWVKGKLRSLHLKSEPSPAMIDLVDKTSTVYYYAAGILLVFSMLLMMALLSDKSGREQAKKEIGEFKGQIGNYVTLYTPLLSTPTKARQIICGHSFCAFWLGEESLIVPVGSIQRIAAYRDTQVR